MVRAAKELCFCLFPRTNTKQVNTDNKPVVEHRGRARARKTKHMGTRVHRGESMTDLSHFSMRFQISFTWFRAVDVKRNPQWFSLHVGFYLNLLFSCLHYICVFTITIRVDMWLQSKWATWAQSRCSAAFFFFFASFFYIKPFMNIIQHCFIFMDAAFTQHLWMSYERSARIS